MIILGISEAHDAHACLLKDGVLLGVVAEERLSRIKTDSRYPRRAIDALLRTTGVEAGEIDLVAFAAKSDWIWQVLYNKHAKFSVQDWIEECDVYWKPVLLEGKTVSPFDVFDHFRHHADDSLDDNPYFGFLQQARETPPEQWGALGDAVRRATIAEHLGIAGDKVRFFRHEDCHKAYGFYSSPYSREAGLLMTLEGGGDDSSATASVIDANGRFRELWKSNAVQAGRLYAYVTLILGMKPGQHEYKVMGLAPYGTEYHGRRSLEFFRKVNRVSGGEIVNDGNLRDLYYTVREALRTERFDGIAWGLQTWLEELTCEWIANNCREQQLDNVILSGGVAQNIKVVKAVAEMDCVRRVWAGPVSGDGSIGVGAAWLAHSQMAPEQPITGMPTAYLGTEYDGRAVAGAIEAAGLRGKYRIIDRPTHEQVAGWLENRCIVSRFSGRMEFGQRALGNRSILADPRFFESVNRINQKIKYRDFWMPFTPSMTAEQADRMLVNPKGLYSPFMTMAFDLKPEYRRAIPAATHPGDKTVRPQMLRREDNPGYHDLMQAFGRRTGLECLMNTSFNLHGEAIVESPQDAISTFERSELDILLFDDVAVSRVDMPEA
ncbi:carbamoyltransferase C-terminal domain-containing protein [Ferrovibrio sp.]|uniref:carbamoyltransferase C-terminal domain-containing protein n=1 Tax=Ferrovibrio sp. TaxID=1917215 RepID=UPI00311E0473